MARRGFPEAAAAHPGAVAGRAQGGGRSPRCPTSTSRRARSFGHREADPGAVGPWTRAGVTGLIVRTDGIEGLELVADLAGIRDTVRRLAIDEPTTRLIRRRPSRASASPASRSTGPRSATPSPRRCAPSCSQALEAHDLDDDVRVTIIRGGGDCFSAGYDLGGDLMDEPPFHSAPGDGAVGPPGHPDAGSTFWDLAKPVIAQVHGYAIAGATELAQACDLVYVADDARIGYPVVRVASPPDWQYHDAAARACAGRWRSCSPARTSPAWRPRPSGGPTGVPGRRARGRGPRRGRAGRGGGAPTWRRSTSAWSTARPRSWACGPPSGPARSSRPSPATSSRSRRSRPTRWR